MGMYDTLCEVPVKCPRCGDESVKKVKIWNGPKDIFGEGFVFGKDKILMDWDSGYPGSLIAKEEWKDNGKIRGEAMCSKCEDRVDKKYEEIREGYEIAGKIKCPEHPSILLACKIDGENAAWVIQNDLDKIYGGSYWDESHFDVAITIKDSVAVEVEVLKR
ncbi:MAG: hypothetical protein PHH85_12815 [Candidatus Methanoperedens sp.]|nr:hypothetical protein [Candidatus Methanoperedens sp.]